MAGLTDYQHSLPQRAKTKEEDNNNPYLSAALSLALSHPIPGP
jgi:hypothetical protein